MMFIIGEKEECIIILRYVFDHVVFIMKPFFIFWDVWMGTHYDTEMRKKAEKKETEARLEELDSDTTLNDVDATEVQTDNVISELKERTQFKIVRSDSKLE